MIEGTVKLNGYVSIPRRGLHASGQPCLFSGSFCEGVSFYRPFTPGDHSFVKVLKLRGGGHFPTVFTMLLKYYVYFPFACQVTP